MLHLFDLDGTLISSYMENADKDYNKWTLLPGRKEHLSLLLAEGHTIAIVTNQGGVAFGKITELDWQHKIFAVLKQLDLVDQEVVGNVGVYVCFADGRSPLAKYRTPIQVARRKPSPAMLQEAMRDFPDAALRGVMMVGDREEDREAALAADVQFEYADAYFAASVENG